MDCLASLDSTGGQQPSLAVKEVIFGVIPVMS